MESPGLYNPKNWEGRSKRALTAPPSSSTFKHYYLVDVFQTLDKATVKKFKEGHWIHFEMPPFCSGDYKAKIHKDKYGLYINDNHNYFPGCRDFQITENE